MNREAERKPCRICRKVFTPRRSRSQATCGKTGCRRRCRAKLRQRMYRTTDKYGARQIIIRRDHRTCLVCRRKTTRPLVTKIDIDRSAVPSNLMTVCRSCLTLPLTNDRLERITEALERQAEKRPVEWDPDLTAALET